MVTLRVVPEGLAAASAAVEALTARLAVPRALVRAADGQFDWKVLEWTGRKAGDDTNESDGPGHLHQAHCCDQRWNRDPWRNSHCGPSYVLLTKAAGFTTVTTQDGYAGQLATSCIASVQTIAKLPNSAPDGYLIEITGETNRSGDNYWVIWDQKGGVWKETVKPGIIDGLNPTTMPRALVRAADGQFDWKVLEWTGRKAGDDTNESDG